MKTKKDPIVITVEQADRLKAIIDLAEAIKHVAIALGSNVVVNITECEINASEIGVSVTTHKQTKDTIKI